MNFVRCAVCYEKPAWRVTRKVKDSSDDGYIFSCEDHANDYWWGIGFDLERMERQQELL